MHKLKPIGQWRFRFNSLGLRLFLIIMVGCMAGIGGMAFLFGEMVKFQAEDQIKSTLRNKVSTINDVIDQAETLAYGLNVSVATLHVRRAETPETYQELTRQLFQGRPDFVTGLGFGQKEYGVLPNQQWLFPYYQIAASNTPSSVAAGDPPESPAATATQADILYIDQADPEYFYPETDRYRDYFLPQVNAWTTPYQSDRGLLLTYYSQIFAPQGEWLGTAVIDVDGTYLSRVLNEPILRNGGKLILLTETGDVIANPSTPSELGTQTYEDISGLSDIWLQLSSSKTLGFVEGETGYWAYTQMPERDWLLMAYVPYDVVFGRVMVITVITTTAVGLLLAVMVALVIRYLNRRLQPVLNECHRLSEIDDARMEQLQNKDELEQLSFSFFYLLEQRAQQLPLLDRVTQRVQLLEQVVTTASEEQPHSQLAQAVQGWTQATANLSQGLAKQALTAESVGNATHAAFETSQQAMTSVMAELELLRQTMHELPQQIQTLSQAAAFAFQAAPERRHIVNLAQVLISNGLSISTRASLQQDPSEFKSTILRFQRLTAQFQELNDEFSQTLIKQQVQRKQARAAEAELSRYVRSFDRYLQKLKGAIEASQTALNSGELTTHQITHLGKQVAQSSEQLGDLMQTMQQTIHHIGAIANETQNRLQNLT